MYEDVKDMVVDYAMDNAIVEETLVDLFDYDVEADDAFYVTQ